MRDRYFCPECNKWYGFFQVRHYVDDFCYCKNCFGAVVDHKKAQKKLTETLTEYLVNSDAKNHTNKIEEVL